MQVPGGWGRGEADIPGEVSGALGGWGGRLVRAPGEGGDLNQSIPPFPEDASKEGVGRSVCELHATSGRAAVLPDVLQERNHAFTFFGRRDGSGAQACATVARKGGMHRRSAASHGSVSLAASRCAPNPREGSTIGNKAFPRG